MSWLVHHTRSEGYASQAEELRRRNDRPEKLAARAS